MRLTILLFWSAAALLPLSEAAAEPPQSKDVVEAAKDAKEKRKSSKTKVIKNSDVKKSKGKIIVLPASDKPVPEKKSELTPDQKYKARLEANERVTVAEKKVVGLEHSVQDLEQQYYETHDPNYRDEVIRTRFDQAKRQLDGARQELADARDALQRIDQPTP